MLDVVCRIRIVPGADKEYYGYADCIPEAVPLIWDIQSALRNESLDSWVKSDLGMAPDGHNFISAFEILVMAHRQLLTNVGATTAGIVFKTVFEKIIASTYKRYSERNLPKREIILYGPDDEIIRHITITESASDKRHLTVTDNIANNEETFQLPSDTPS